MSQITYLTRLCRDEFSLRDAQFNFKIDVPRFCPFCQTPQRGTVVGSKLWAVENGQYYETAMYSCNNCDKKFLANFSLDTNKKTGSFNSFHPVLEVSYENDILEPISPRFVQLYTQALRAETAGDNDLAATGYRDAIECLIKDYAIAELKVEKDVVVKKNLFEAIGEYLDSDMAKSADVVRILGNDFTHYQRKYPEYDFDILKAYLEYFISLIERQVKINHAPIGRA